jgi:hypothetical protein
MIYVESSIPMYVRGVGSRNFLWFYQRGLEDTFGNNPHQSVFPDVNMNAVGVRLLWDQRSDEK